MSIRVVKRSYEGGPNRHYSRDTDKWRQYWWAATPIDSFSASACTFAAIRLLSRAKAPIMPPLTHDRGAILKSSFPGASPGQGTGKRKGGSPKGQEGPARLIPGPRENIPRTVAPQPATRRQHAGRSAVMAPRSFQPESHDDYHGSLLSEGADTTASLRHN